jgi:hypothetical protein
MKDHHKKDIYIYIYIFSGALKHFLTGMTLCLTILCSFLSVVLYQSYYDYLPFSLNNAVSNIFRIIIPKSRHRLRDNIKINLKVIGPELDDLTRLPLNLSSLENITIVIARKDTKCFEQLNSYCN